MAPGASNIEPDAVKRRTTKQKKGETNQYLRFRLYCFSFGRLGNEVGRYGRKNNFKRSRNS